MWWSRCALLGHPSLSFVGPVEWTRPSVSELKIRFLKPDEPPGTLLFPFWVPDGPSPASNVFSVRAEVGPGFRVWQRPTVTDLFLFSGDCRKMNRVIGVLGVSV